MTAIDPHTIKTIQTTLERDSKHQAVQRAVTKNGVYKSSQNNQLNATNTRIFSDAVKAYGVTDQKASGRCWLFATLSLLRHEIADSLKLDNFELSQSYSFFWDKLEKCNVFYEEIIATAASPLDDRKLAGLLQDPQGDGGWWSMSVAVIEKYGVVPKGVMDEAAPTSHSGELNHLLNTKLRADALALRTLAQESPKQARKQKDALLQDVYRLLSATIGTPPTSFDFVYKDKKEKYHRVTNLTPLSFLQRYVKTNLHDYVALMNNPSPSKIYNQPYLLEGTKSIDETTDSIFLNVTMDDMKRLSVKQLKQGKTVWFACDILARTTRDGYMSPDAYDFDGTFDIDFSLTKAERLMTRDSAPNHAMLLTGVDIVKGQPTQWQVENSHGEKVGDKGFFTMSDSWMDEYTYVVVILRRFLPQRLLRALKKQPITLPPWDSFS